MKNVIKILPVVLIISILICGCTSKSEKVVAQSSTSVSVNTTESEISTEANTTTTQVTTEKASETTTKPPTTQKRITTTKDQTTKLSTTRERTTTTTKGCANGNHSMPVGNMGRWFSSRNELISYYNDVVNSWNNKVDSGEISNEEYFANVPMGYECWSCSECGKWTGNFKYDR